MASLYGARPRNGKKPTTGLNNMKYLYLLIRHIFPRRRWKLVNTTAVYDEDDIDGLPLYRKHVLRDQFGNIKVKKV